jgi:hypothetical protein
MTQEEMKEYISHWLNQNKIKKQQLVFQASSLSTDSKGKKKAIIDKTIEIIDEGCFVDLIIYEGNIGKRKSFFRLYLKEEVIVLIRKHMDMFYRRIEYKKI